MPDQIDTSIYAHQPIDPGATAFNAITNFANAQNAIVGAKSNMMQLRARQAMGPILQGAIGPDGNIDYNKAALGMAANPDTAWMANDFINQAVQREYTQAETVKTHLENAMTHYQGIGSAAASLIAKGNDVTSKDVMGGMADLIGSGIIDMPTAMNFMKNLPADGAPLAAFLKQTAARADGASKTIAAVNSGVNVVPTGGGSAITQNVPSQGINTQLGTTTNTPTPEQLGQPQPFLENGRQMTGPRGEVLSLPSGQPGAYTPAGATGQNPIIGPANGGGSGGGNPPATGGNPIMGPSNGPQTAPSPQPNSAPAPVGGARNTAGAVQTGFAPGEEQRQEQQGTDWSTYRKGLDDFVSTNRTMMQQLQGATEAAKQFQMGPGRETMGNMATAAKGLRNMLETFGVSPDKLKGMDELVSKLAGGDPKDPQALGAMQEFEKIALQNAMLVLRNAIGGQGRLTNLEFQKFEEANPNISLDPNGFVKIVNLLKTITNTSRLEQQAANRWEDLHDTNPAKYPFRSFRPTWEQELVKRKIIDLEPIQPGDIRGTQAAPQ
jgi:hypothetical protein